MFLFKKLGRRFITFVGSSMRLLGKLNLISGFSMWLKGDTQAYTSGSIVFTASDKASAQIADAAISPANALDPLTDDVFIWGWVYPTSVTGTQWIIGKGAGGGTEHGFAIIRSATSLIAYFGTGTNYSITLGTVAASTWYFFALIIDRNGNGNATGYLNAVAGSPVNVSAASGTSVDSAGVFCFGKYSYSSATSSEWFSGSLAAIGIGFPADASLITQTDIDWLYNAKTPRLYHDFDADAKTKFGLLAGRGGFWNCNPSIAPDATHPIVDQHLGNNLTFTATNMLASANGTFETRTGVTGISFAAGDKAHLECADNDALDIADEDFIPNVNLLRTSTGEQVIFSKYEDANNRYTLKFDSNNKLHFIAKVAGNTHVEMISANAYTSTTTKYHVQVVVDRSNAANCKFYVNGTADIDGTPTLTDPIPSLANSGKLYVGQLGDGTLYFNGRIAMLGIGKPADVTAAGVVTALGNIDGTSGLGQYYNEQSSADKTAMAWSCFWDGTEASGTRTDWIDDLELTEVCTTNLVTNGDFATNDTTGWTNHAAYPWDTADASSGACNLVLNGDGNPLQGVFYQQLPIVSGRSYYISYNATQNGANNLYVQYCSTAGGGAIGYNTNHTITTNVSNAVIAPTGSNGYLLFFAANSAARNWTLDNVSVTAANIPCASDADVFGSWGESAPSGGRVDVETLTAQAGACSVRLLASTAGTANVAQAILTVGNTYSVSVQSKNTAATVQARAYCGTAQLFASDSTSWGERTGTATCAGNTYFYLYAWGTTANYAFFDTVTLYATSLQIGNGPSEAVCKDSVGTNDGIPTGFTAAQLRTAWTRDVPAALGSGTALVFDGAANVVTGQLDTIQNASTDSFTISAWIKTSTNGIIFANGWLQAGTSPGYTLYVSSSGNVLAFICDSTGTTLNSVLSSASVATGQWLHASVVYANKVVTLYINGAQDGQKTLTLSGNIYTSGRRPLIGAANNTADGNYYGFFNGSIDDVRYYSSALTPAQIAQLAAGTDVTTNLVAKWTFDDGPQGTPSQDSPIYNWISDDDTRYRFSQGTASLAPSYNLLGLGTGPTLYFDGSDDYMTYNNTIPTDTQGTLIIAFAAGPTAFADRGDQCLFAVAKSGDTQNYFEYGIDSAGKIFVETRIANSGDRIIGNTVLSPSGEYFIGISSNGSAYSMYVNNVTQTLTATSGANRGHWFGDIPNANNMSIGRLITSSLYDAYEGDIGDILMDNAYKSEGNIRNICTTLAGRFDITL